MIFAFAIERFCKTGESVTSTLKAFRTHFILRRNYAVPDRKSILLWIKIKPSEDVEALELQKISRWSDKLLLCSLCEPIKIEGVSSWCNG